MMQIPPSAEKGGFKYALSYLLEHIGSAGSDLEYLLLCYIERKCLSMKITPSPKC